MMSMETKLDAKKDITWDIISFYRLIPWNWSRELFELFAVNDEINDETNRAVSDIQDSIEIVFYQWLQSL